MKKYKWALGLLVVGIFLIMADIATQALKPEAKKVAVGMGISGTALVIISAFILFSIKPLIVIS